LESWGQMSACSPGMIRGCRDWPFMAAEILGVDLSLPQDVLHFAALHHPHCRHG
jgi:hypothetical protein